MPAYFTYYPKPMCMWPKCDLKADGQVRNGHNEVMGDYCRAHSFKKVAELNEEPTR